jgi:hypothetical protein
VSWILLPLSIGWGESQGEGSVQLHRYAENKNNNPAKNMKPIILIALALAVTGTFSLAAAETEQGFTPLMDGKTFDGWKMAEENKDTWKIVDGAFVANGPRCHLYYVGDGKPFKNFHLKAEVMTEPNSNGGIYFHTKYQSEGWPKGGFECQVNNTHSDWIKTGSLYGIANTGLTAAQDKKWWTQEILVEGNKVTVSVDGKKVLQYVEPASAQAGNEFARKLGEGTFALQGHDPGSTIRYKNIRVKRLD